MIVNPVSKDYNPIRSVMNKLPTAAAENPVSNSRWSHWGCGTILAELIRLKMRVP